MGKRIKFYLPGRRAAVCLFLGSCFLLGGILGYAFLGTCGEEMRDSLAAYLRDYVCVVAASQVDIPAVPVLWSEVRFGLAAFLLGWTSLALIGYPLLFALRGFLLCFSFGAFCVVFGPEGAIPACVLFLLPALFWGPALFLLGSEGLLGRVLGAGHRNDSGDRGRERWRLLSLAFLLLLGSCVFSCLLLPKLASAAVYFVL